MKQPGSRKRRRIRLAVIPCGAGFAAFHLLGGGNTEAVSPYRESAVEVRSTTNSLSSSGTLQPVPCCPAEAAVP